LIYDQVLVQLPPDHQIIAEKTIHKSSVLLLSFNHENLVSLVAGAPKWVCNVYATQTRRRTFKNRNF